MKNILLLFSVVLIISCEILDSSDVDENSTFLERFDGIGFSEKNSESENITYFFNDDVFMKSVFLNGFATENECDRFTSVRRGENYVDCAGEVSYNVTITENLYDRIRS